MNSLAQLLAHQREAIIGRVKQQAREHFASGTPVAALLLGALPGLLDALQATLEQAQQGHPGPAMAPPVGVLPAAELGAVELTRACGLLRDSLLALLEESGGALKFSELRVLHRFLDQAVLASAAEAERDEAPRMALALLESILESIPDVVYVGDARGITHANAPARGLLGPHLKACSPRELGERLKCRDAETDKPLDSGEEPFLRALRGEAVTRELVMCPPGRQQGMVVRCAAAPVRMGERIVGAVVINTDLTAHREREEELRRTAEFRERFLGIVSHDLRNPLNAIALSANLLLREDDVTPRARKAAGRIAQSAERMARMIGDLLDFTRGRLGGGIPISRQALDLHHICHPVLEELRVARPERELRLRVEGDLLGQWDGDRLAQLVGNLVKNALDYSPEDQPVTVALRGEDRWVELQVHNQGEPISPQLLSGLFEPFRRGMRHYEASQSSGLGLGLFIANQISLAHGGTLEAHSKNEEGTTFTLRLPRATQGSSRP